MHSGETTYSEETLVKIIKQDKHQRDFVYKTGLNILNKPFQPEGSCVPGGLYYTTLNKVHNYYHYGTLLVIVKIPDDAQIVQDPDKTYGKKWRTDKITLCEEYPLFDVKTIKKFNLKITPDYIIEACVNGKMTVALLKFLRDSKFVQLEHYELVIIHCACEYNQFDVLDWLCPSDTKR